MDVYGMAYPVTNHPLGYLRPVKNLKVLEADLLLLLLTEPGERVMLPEFGTPLNQFLFEPNDEIELDNIRSVISDAIERWERRIAVDAIEVTQYSDSDDEEGSGHTLHVLIKYKEYGNILNIQELSLALPIGG